MSRTLFCTSDTKMLNSETHLYLPYSWHYQPANFSEFTILDMELMRNKLYITGHGPLWCRGNIFKREYWRILGSLWPLSRIQPSTKLWVADKDPVMAEPVSFEELKLEAVFLLP